MKRAFQCLGNLHKAQRLYLLNGRSYSRGLAAPKLTSNGNGYEKNSKVRPKDLSGIQRISHREHILLRPDTYIGPTSLREMNIWLYNKKMREMELKTCNYSPGLIKIFDEILVNAADNKTRCPAMKKIEVYINREAGEISILNDGEGIPIRFSDKEGMYIPTLIFGELLTSSNYADTESRTVGGRNGYGAKLCNIYSERFEVETVSSSNGLHFKQSWSENMQHASKPEIQPTTSTDFTKVTFKPDFEKFGMTELAEEVAMIMEKRVIDIAGTLRGVDVYLNGEKIMVESFEDYIKLYCQDFVYMNLSPRWQVGISRSSDGFQHISFVNNIHTFSGGTHVDLVTAQIVDVLKSEVEKELQKTVKPSMIKNYLCVFVNSTIINPEFVSQTKEKLTLQSSKFGSTVKINAEKMLHWARETGLIEDIITEVKNKKTRVSRSRRAAGLELLEKLEDANFAGGSKSADCTLIVTEGDSAKALAVAGLEVVGRDRFGVFPIKGKLINVSDVDQKKVVENQEISSIMKILGLSFDTDYSSDIAFKKLRYGRLMILADQDEDGSHIKGLLLNMFCNFWPDLVKRGFVSSFRTPLVKARKAGEIHSFYRPVDFHQWFQQTLNADKFSIKYYKGLGTSTSAEGREYFREMDKNTVRFLCESDADGESIKMAFEKGRAEDRKIWIKEMTKVSDDDDEPVGINNAANLSDFVNKDLFQYSKLALKRSIPSSVDGLKPSQRKILQTLLKRGENKEIKVSQLAGAVSASQAYHHGEEALVNTIVRMAQDFVGSKNLPLLKAVGQFGTRHEGGADAASARYIHTKLSSFAKFLIVPADEPLLEYLVEENLTVEPKCFYPILPLILINGAEGIGMGWSTAVLPHSIHSVADAVRRKIEQEPEKELIPSWNGFTGQVSRIGNNSYEIIGKSSILKEKRNGIFDISISELPVGVWTNNYKKRVILPLLKDSVASDLREYHTERGVNFQISVRGEKSLKKAANRTSLLKLRSVQSTNSMVLFDSSNVLRKFSSTSEILEDYFTVRKDVYLRRIEYQKQNLEAQMRRTENQLVFIRLFLENKICLRNKSRSQLIAEVQNLGLQPDPVLSTQKDRDGFSYLLDLSLGRFTTEEVGRLEEKCKRQTKEFEDVRSSKWQDVWTADIERLLKDYHRTANSDVD